MSETKTFLLQFKDKIYSNRIEEYYKILLKYLLS
jgi:hypothetical protein